jgi:hypothetical protein
MKPGQIKIPHSELAERLDEVAAIKRRMVELLTELEVRVIGPAAPPIERPGGWRHDPLGWARRHKVELPGADKA